MTDDLLKLSETSSLNYAFANVNNAKDRPVCEISKAQLLLLDKLNLQNIIDTKNMAHAMTALDLLKLDGYLVD